MTQQQTGILCPSWAVRKPYLRTSLYRIEMYIYFEKNKHFRETQQASNMLDMQTTSVHDDS